MGGEMSDKKLDQAVFKIFSLTHEGRLVWEHKSVPRLWQQGTDDVYPVYFETEYQNRKLALFQRRSRMSENDREIARIVGDPVDDWGQSTHLALLGSNDEILFEFPWSRQVHDLFKAVSYKAANVDEFLDALLNSEVTDEKQ
jgi:hypothetical protein